VAIPGYSSKDPLHCKVAELAEECHAASSAGQTGLIEGLEERLDRAVAEVLSIPTAKLKVMRDELKLLRGTISPVTDQDD
jgi:hypothetical protein